MIAVCNKLHSVYLLKICLLCVCCLELLMELSDRPLFANYIVATILIPVFFSLNQRTVVKYQLLALTQNMDIEGLFFNLLLRLCGAFIDVVAYWQILFI